MVGACRNPESFNRVNAGRERPAGLKLPPSWSRVAGNSARGGLVVR